MPDLAEWSKRARTRGRACVEDPNVPDFDAMTGLRWDALWRLFMAGGWPHGLPKEGAAVLDFGCGVGRFAAKLRDEMKARVMGYDPCTELLTLAPPLDDVTYTTVPPSGPFDLIWCINVLGGLEGQALTDAVAYMAGALRPNGVLFLAENSAAPHATSTGWRFRLASDYQAMFAAAGITVGILGTYAVMGVPSTAFMGRHAEALLQTTIVHSGGSRPFFCRPGTSDIAMAKQAFEDRAFDLCGLKRWPDIERWLAAHPEPLIVDAGANIGTSSVWFAMAFPNARIIALEPEASNLAMLCRNTAGLLVKPLGVALSGEGGCVETYHPCGAPTADCGHAGFRTRPVDAGTLAMTMDEILGNLPVDPFLAKIDIEGAEADVFAADRSWIERFPVLIVELHDWLYPGEGTSHGFLQAMAGRDRDFVLRGEHVISIRNPI